MVSIRLGWEEVEATRDAGFPAALNSTYLDEVLALGFRDEGLELWRRKRVD